MLSTQALIMSKLALLLAAALIQAAGAHNIFDASALVQKKVEPHVAKEQGASARIQLFKILSDSMTQFRSGAEQVGLMIKRDEPESLNFSDPNITAYAVDANDFAKDPTFKADYAALFTKLESSYTAIEKGVAVETEKFELATKKKTGNLGPEIATYHEALVDILAKDTELGFNLCHDFLNNFAPKFRNRTLYKLLKIIMVNNTGPEAAREVRKSTAWIEASRRTNTQEQNCALIGDVSKIWPEGANIMRMGINTAKMTKQMIPLIPITAPDADPALMDMLKSVLSIYIRRLESYRTFSLALLKIRNTAVQNMQCKFEKE